MNRLPAKNLALSFTQFLHRLNFHILILINMFSMNKSHLFTSNPQNVNVIIGAA